MKKILIFILSIVVNANLLFSMGRRPSLKLVGKIVYGICLIDIETGKWKICGQPQGNGNIFGSLLSPDGNRILLDYELGKISDTNKGNELRIIDLDGENEITLLDDRYGFFYTWSPDSKFLVATGIGMPFEYLIINTSSNEFWRLEIPESKVKGLTQPYWTKDGKSIMLSALLNEQEEKNAFMKIDLDGSNFKIMTYLPKQVGMVVLSPDEKMLAYTPILEENLYVMNIDGSNIRLMPKNNKTKSFPFWSPDSEWIGCCTNNSNMNDLEFIVWNLETMERRKLPLPSNMLESIQWWVPQTESPVDCEKIIREMLGQGKKLETLISPQ